MPSRANDRVPCLAWLEEACDSPHIGGDTERRLYTKTTVQLEAAQCDKNKQNSVTVQLGDRLWGFVLVAAKSL